MGHRVPMVGGNVTDWRSCWVFEQIVADDGVPVPLLLQLYGNKFSPTGDGTQENSPPPAPISIRLFLRVLSTDQQISVETAATLTDIRRVVQRYPFHFPITTPLQQLLPTGELQLEVLTQLVLSTTAAAGAQDAESIRDVYSTNIAHFLSESEHTSWVDPQAIAARKQELLTFQESLVSPSLDHLWSHFPEYVVREGIQKYVGTARLALGPTFLEVVEQTVIGGQFPNVAGTYVGQLLPAAKSIAYPMQQNPALVQDALNPPRSLPQAELPASSAYPWGAAHPEPALMANLALLPGLPILPLKSPAPPPASAAQPAGAKPAAKRKRDAAEEYVGAAALLSLNQHLPDQHGASTAGTRPPSPPHETLPMPQPPMLLNPTPAPQPTGLINRPNGARSRGVEWVRTSGGSDQDDADIPSQMEATASGNVTPAGEDRRSPSPASTPAEGGSAHNRRRVGRWTEEETQVLIDLVHKMGKGKWKQILDASEGVLSKRSQVDLKDKWRNLERQGVVPVYGKVKERGHRNSLEPNPDVAAAMRAIALPPQQPMPLVAQRPMPLPAILQEQPLSRGPAPMRLKDE